MFKVSGCFTQFYVGVNARPKNKIAKLYIAPTKQKQDFTIHKTLKK